MGARLLVFLGVTGLLTVAAVTGQVERRPDDSNQTREPLRFRAPQTDYDFRDKVFRYGILNASFDYQCVLFNAEVKLFYREKGSVFQGSPFEFRIGFSLGNLGMVSNFFGGK